MRKMILVLSTVSLIGLGSLVNMPRAHAGFSFGFELGPRPVYVERPVYVPVYEPRYVPVYETQYVPVYETRYVPRYVVDRERYWHDRGHHYGWRHDGWRRGHWEREE